jgi:hypothetical protein
MSQVGAKGRRGPALAAAVAALGAVAAYVVVARSGCIPEVCGPSVGSVLRNLQARQESHLAEHGAYATSLPDLGVEPVDAVTVTLLHATPQGWSARAAHDELPRMSCVIWEGTVPQIPVTDRALAADEPSRPYCDFPT